LRYAGCEDCWCVFVQEGDYRNGQFGITHDRPGAASYVDSIRLKADQAGGTRPSYALLWFAAELIVIAMRR
jgi:hypothetical protein